MGEWFFPIVSALMMVAAFVAERQARKRSEVSLGHLRDATDKYRDAKAVREEAYRALALAARITRRRSSLPNSEDKR